MRKVIPVIFFAICSFVFSPHSVFAVNPNRVLILVNDAMPAESGTGGVGASIFVGQHYAVARGIPSANILHLTCGTGYFTSYAEYQAQIEAPVKAFLDANGGTMKHQIIYIVATYGVPNTVGGTPLKTTNSLLSGMYTFYIDGAQGGQLNPYLGVDTSGNPYTNLWTQPPAPKSFEAFADQRESSGLYKMFVVTALDGLSATVSAALVDKAIAAEAGALRPTTGTAYWDWQGTRNNTEWQLWYDTRMRDGAVLTQKLGLPTLLHSQTTATNFVWEPRPAGVPISLGGEISAPNAIFGFGWYKITTQGQYTWAPGGIGSHLISCSGTNIRNPAAEIAGTSNRWGCSWMGRFIEDGATATWGTVDEPLANNHGEGIDFAAMFYGYGLNFGDSFYLTQHQLQWTVFAVGDPLFQPRGIVSPKSLVSRGVRMKGQ